MHKFNPQGLTAVITGGGSGIGQALSQALVQRGSTTVVVADLNLAAARDVAQQLGPCALAMEIDVADAGSVARVVEQVSAKHGPIDLWCSNAGLNVGDGIGELSDWHRSLSVNVMGHVHAARALMPAMKQRGKGWFVVTSSAAGLLSDMRTAPYSTSKHAAVGFAEWLSITSRGDGVSVHCICPEGVRTAMTKASSEQAGKGLVFLEADEVAAHALDRITAGEFLILPHPRVAEFEVRRATDRQRWIETMHRAFMRMQGRIPAET